MSNTAIILAVVAFAVIALIAALSRRGGPQVTTIETRHVDPSDPE